MFKTLFTRYSQRKVRDKVSLTIQLCQAPVISGLLGMLFWKEGADLIGWDISPELEKIPDLLVIYQLQSGIHPTMFLIGAAAFTAAALLSSAALAAPPECNRQ